MKRAIVLLAVACVASALVSQTATAAPQTATGYTTFSYPRLVETFMSSYLNKSGEFSGVHATEVNRYRITLKGTYQGYVPFTAYLTKASSQRVKVTLYAMGQHMSQTVNAGFDL